MCWVHKQKINFSQQWFLAPADHFLVLLFNIIQYRSLFLVQDHLWWQRGKIELQVSWFLNTVSFWFLTLRSLWYKSRLLWEFSLRHNSQLPVNVPSPKWWLIFKKQNKKPLGCQKFFGTRLFFSMLFLPSSFTGVFFLFFRAKILNSKSSSGGSLVI